MKKLFILFAILFVSKGLFAQEENNLKNFRFGLKVAPVFNWLRPDLKKIDGAGASVGFKYGLITEFRLSSVASFVTGIEGSHLGGKLNYTDSAVYRVFDDAFVSAEDFTALDSASKLKSGRYLLKESNIRVTYITIPIALKLKTKDIGGMTYFGMFGGDLNIKAGSKLTDNSNLSALTAPASGTKFDPTKIDYSKDMNFFTVNLNVGGGLEYNLSGTTSFLAGINYNRGFLSATKADSDILTKGKYENTGAYSQKAFMDGIAITVGILF